MTEFIPGAHVIASLLLTYLIHSTVVFLLIDVVLRCWGATTADVRALLWKVALVVPITTSLTVALVDVPQVGPTFNIACAPRGEESSDLPWTTQARRKKDTTDLSESRGHWSASDSSEDQGFANGRSQVISATEGEPLAAYQPVPNFAASVPVWSIFILVCFVGSLLGGIRDRSGDPTPLSAAAEQACDRSCRLQFDRPLAHESGHSDRRRIHAIQRVSRANDGWDYSAVHSRSLRVSGNAQP